MDTNIPDITLVKVPKFLALQWRNCKNHSIIGNCKRNEKGDLEELRVECEGEQLLFKCRKTTITNPLAVQINSKSTNLRFISKLSECLTVFPSLDQIYKNKLKQRHIASNIQKSRSTTNETREDPSFDSSETIFKYYNPKTVTLPSLATPDTPRPVDDTPYNRAKAKSKKMPPMDPDELKLKIFKIFESEEAKDGVQLKRLVQLTGQPVANLKPAVEEIATLKRRPSDHKMAYFLNDH